MASNRTHEFLLSLIRLEWHETGASRQRGDFIQVKALFLLNRTNNNEQKNKVKMFQYVVTFLRN
ncbi:hypothetical protein B7P33_15970 [Sediminicola luteus]|uniref:Uncharacterized protein n=1 Tax=Sediminicola luteus TaxID=319238 RepID=A0A2A4G2X8_9FLAO|nr:hypothetical protein B7P33_15970 [Sediminicola luteus]